MIAQPAPAKINLALHVRARRGDGYHALETLFAFVADGDVLHLDPAGPAGLRIAGPFAGGLVPDDPANLVLRAEAAFRADIAPVPPGAWLLDKRLPVASGIGGGSADAAAALRALAFAHGIARDDARLFAIAAALGSDVPACLSGRPAIGRGRGELLEPLPPLPPLPVLLVNPRAPLSTAAVFARWDGVDRGALPEGAPLEAARAARNDLEAPARSLAPAIDGVLTLLAAQHGVTLARMSGSGATCFALFGHAADRTAAARAIAAAQPGWWCLETTLAAQASVP